jgi:succinyl-CoA synthetase beta subunit
MIDEFALLKKYKFKLIPYELAKSEQEAVKIANKIKYPVVLKIVSREIVHKSEWGGVITGIRNDKALVAAYKEIIENTRGKNVEGIMVQKMARKGLELIIGGKKDPQFGQIIVLGLGGIYVEVFRDIAARVCPITHEDIREMLYQLKSHPILMGMRGKKPICLKCLDKLLMKTCELMCKENIDEIDLNPVIFDDKGYDIVDVRFKRSAK